MRRIKWSNENNNVLVKYALKHGLKPSKEERDRLASMLGVDHRHIQVWFYNESQRKCKRVNAYLKEQHGTSLYLHVLLHWRCIHSVAKFVQREEGLSRDSSLVKAVDVLKSGDAVAKDIATLSINVEFGRHCLEAGSQLGIVDRSHPLVVQYASAMTHIDFVQSLYDPFLLGVISTVVPN